MSLEEIVDKIAMDHLEGARIKAEFVSARCPFHGVDQHPSFWLSRTTGKWGCFTCSAGGSGLKWLLKDLGLKVRGIDQILEEAEKDRTNAGAIAKLQRKKKAKAEFTGVHILPENILGLWDMCPVALLEAGFSEQVLSAHDVGFDEQRLRITFPIRDVAGNLVGVSGRSVDGSWPKYKVYQGYHDKVTEAGSVIRDPGELGAWFSDYSSTNIRDHLYRGHVVYPRCLDQGGDYLVVVEGYKACLWMVQQGYENTVALMGAKMSATQERLIRRMGVPTYVLLDNNAAGQSGADHICRTLGSCTFPVYRCSYLEDHDVETQPDDLNEDEVREVFEGAVRAVGRIRNRYDDRSKKQKTRPTTNNPQASRKSW